MELHNSILRKFFGSDMLSFDAAHGSLSLDTNTKLLESSITFDAMFYRLKTWPAR